MEKTFLILLATLGILATSACTSEEGKLKKQALATAERQFVELIEKEAEFLSQSDYLRDGYIRFFKSNSEIEVHEVKMVSENLATVSTVVNSYAPSLRRTILEVAARMDPAKARQFNFANAASLVAQEKGISAEKMRQASQVFKFSKAGDSWVLNN